jgi:hypothetical protein
MGRKKPKRRFEVIRTAPPPTEKHKNIMFLFGRMAIIPVIIGLQRAKMNPMNIALIGFWVIWVIFDAVLTVEWKQPLARQITKSIYLRVFVVLVIGGITILFAIASYLNPVHDTTNEKLDTILANIEATNVMKRLESEYDLGFVLIAFTGETDATRVRSHTKQINADWQKCKAGIDERGDVWIQLPKLNIISDDGARFSDPGSNMKLGFAGGLGSKSVPITIGNIEMIEESIRQEPIGHFVALGFRHKPNANK